ncbi:MAG: hypothetical protein OEW86_05265 [Nitrosopumilus sp.]|nr:hypothetical protein [Nitrosopumilus sp.]MDH3515781.1 hypothetical protein [Nitrosopumilus sp.]MDH5417385.1 hypothetical protein [Nitrosopumilus sp.]MDH5555448.1 hypothetical protein [Nitrosopumilus sp.]
MDKNFIRRRWFDFRQGHSYYLIFALSFANFILIFYRLLIEQIPELNEIFSSLWIFVVVFILLYIPIAIGIGAWHRKTQLKIEADVSLKQSPLFCRVLGTIIDIQMGTATKEEIQELRKMLKKIESGQGQSN